MGERSRIHGTDLGGMFPRNFTKEYLALTRGDGPYVWDADGNRYVDAVSGNKNVNIGHGVSEVAEAARRQLERLEFTGMRFANRPAIEFTDKIREFAPGPYGHAWVVSGGSLANESAVKMARQYHVERGNERKYKVISRSRSYHGSTIGAMAWSGCPEYKSSMEPLMVDSPKVPSGNRYRCEFCDGTGGRECGVWCADEVDRLIESEDPATVAAFMAEPVSGAGNAGAYPHDGYFERIAEICEEHDVLFIADEILTGFGRTGEVFAMEHWDVTPDIVTVGKGLTAGYAPVGAVLPHDRVADVFRTLDHGFSHGHTYTFNPVSAAIGLEVLEYIDRNDLVERARSMGRHLGERLEALYEFPWVGDVRGKGLMYGVEFVADRATKEPLAASGEKFHDSFRRRSLDNGLILAANGGHAAGRHTDQTLVAPPLVVDEALVDEIVARLEATLEDVAVDLAL